MAQYTQGLYQSIIKSRVFQFLSHRLDTRLVYREWPQQHGDLSQGTEVFSNDLEAWTPGPGEA